MEQQPRDGCVVTEEGGSTIVTVNISVSCVGTSLSPSSTDCPGKSSAHISTCIVITILLPMKAAMVTAVVTSGWNREDTHFQILNALDQ